MRLRAIAASIVGGAGLCAVLLALAGTVDWPAARVWTALFVVAGVIGSLLAPTAVLRERMRGPIRSRQSRADVVFVLLFGPLLLGWFVLVPLDAVRFEWTAVPAWLRIVGIALFAAANGLAIWVLRANPFASASVRIADDHQLATGGPCAVVRHPMYSSVVLYFPGSALVLGSVLGVVASVPVVIGLAVRTRIEERALRDGLPGYVDYAAQVRWRLVPGVW